MGKEAEWSGLLGQSGELSQGQAPACERCPGGTGSCTRFAGASGAPCAVAKLVCWDYRMAAERARQLAALGLSPCMGKRGDGYRVCCAWEQAEQAGAEWNLRCEGRQESELDEEFGAVRGG